MATGTAATSLSEALAGWEDRPLEEKVTLRAALRRLRWRFQARHDQLPPQDDWSVLYLAGGRGSGKSWAAAHTFAEEIMDDPHRAEGEWAVVAPTFADARDKCIESTESGLLLALGTSKAEIDAGKSAVVKAWNRSIGELILHDGTRVYIDGADDGAYRIQGYNLRGVWADEIGLWKKWQVAWDESIGFALRKGRSRIVATGTPKRAMPARRLVRRLIEEARTNPRTVYRRLKTADNWHNLSDAFRQAVSRFVGTTLGAQELEGVLLENAEGALWRLDWIEQTRVESLPEGHFWQRPPVLGVDPSDGTEEGAEQGYALVGLSSDHDLYVVESDGIRGVSPTSFARQMVLLAKEHGAVIVVEKNHGGAYLIETFRRAMKDLAVDVPLKTVTASQGKLTRAEPVAALYEPRTIDGRLIPGRVHHVGYLDALEDQMVNFTGAQGERSPDRLDALVWALSEFTRQEFGPPAPDHLDRAVPYPGQAAASYDFVEQVPNAGASYAEDGAVPWR